MKSKKQMGLVMRLVVVGVPGETAAILGAACFDQARLSSRLFGPPVLNQTDATTAVEAWLKQHSGYSVKEGRPVSPDVVRGLVQSVFGRS